MFSRSLTPRHILQLPSFSSPSLHVPFRSFGTRPGLPSFDNSQEAYAAKSTAKLLRAELVFALCTWKSLVKNSETLLKTSRKVFGDTITDGVLKKTFFGHFCAGEDEESIKPTVKFLQSHGIGGILDYAAEGDLDDTNEKETKNEEKPLASTAPIGVEMGSNGVQCRIYTYKDEKICDKNTEIFLDCIRAVHNVTPEGFAAVKLTALGNPLLLERMSTALLEIRSLFKKFDKKGHGKLNREEFRAGYREFFVDIPDTQIDQLFNKFDADGSGKIDIVEWTKNIRLEDLDQLISKCLNQGPLYNSALNREEQGLMKALNHRLMTLADEARKLEVRLMIDAEQSYFQPAIDNTVLDLQRKYNKTFPAIFSTYQCYLKDSAERLSIDLQRAKNEGFYWAAKLVRGAYMNLERSRAQSLNYPSPIHETKKATHENYARCTEAVLKFQSQPGARSNVLIATHNQKSVELTLELMEDLKLDKGTGGVYFGQLLGMADHLTFSLGRNGYKAYKYVPYGQVKEVVPYLLRRAQENSDVLGGVKKELSMLSSELRRRMNPLRSE